MSLQTVSESDQSKITLGVKMPKRVKGFYWVSSLFVKTNYFHIVFPHNVRRHKNSEKLKTVLTAVSFQSKKKKMLEIFHSFPLNHIQAAKTQRAPMSSVKRKKTRTWLNFCWKPMQRHPGLPVKHRQGRIPGGLLCKTTAVMWQFRKELCSFMTFRESHWKSCHSISVDETVYKLPGTSHEEHNWTIDTGTRDYNLRYHHNHFNTALWLFIN